MVKPSKHSHKAKKPRPKVSHQKKRCQPMPEDPEEYIGQLEAWTQDYQEAMAWEDADTEGQPRRRKRGGARRPPQPSPEIEHVSRKANTGRADQTHRHHRP